MYRYMDMDQVIEEALSLAETELTYEDHESRVLDRKRKVTVKAADSCR